MSRTAVAVVSAALTLIAPAAASADESSLYHGPGPRPGPDLLYAPPADAPQLDNAPGSVWQAPPILVSGATAYRDGEFIYQDFLFDDHGAKQALDPADPREPGNLFSQPHGTYTYPTDPAYGNNAADLVELRVRPLADATAFRVTLNTMKDPTLIAFSIAIGGSSGASHAFPDGANVSAPADVFLTVHPSGGTLVGELVRAADASPVVGPAPAVSVDPTRRQIEVRIPHADWDPGTSVVRLAAGVGLWDKANNRYLLPGPSATATTPGGAGLAANPAAFFNVAFRTDEPLPVIKDVPNTATGPAWWRDKQQGQALAQGDITALHADVDFAKLAAAVNDDSGVPQTGPIDRILASHFETAQGIDYAHTCLTAAATCNGEYQTQLQPYAIYVPRKSMPRNGYGLTLLLHSLSTNYNQYLGSRNQAEFGERGPGSVVMTSESRGPDGSFTSYAEADVFEVWADIARRYKLDPDWTSITGYSMGGIGTFTLGEQFPDLFARAQPTVGESPDNAKVASLRNLPFLMWNMAVDELVPAVEYVPTARALDAAGYRYELDVFAPGEHNMLAINDEYAPAAAFLGTATVDRDPAHVTYVLDPTTDYPKLGFVSDHAYWLSGLTVRTPPASTNLRAQSIQTGPSPQIDVFSHGFGVGDPQPSSTQLGAGTLLGGTLPAMLYTRTYKTWGPTPSIPTADRLDINAVDVSHVAIDVARAHVDCHAALNVVTDGPLTIHLQGCAGNPRRFDARTGAGACKRRSSLTIALRHPRGARVLAATAFINGHRVRSARAARGRSLRAIRVRLPRSGRTLHVRIALVLVVAGHTRHATERRAVPACSPMSTARRG